MDWQTYIRVLRNEHGEGTEGGGGGDASNAGGSPGGDEKKFTESDVNAVVQSRLARERKAYESKLADVTRSADEKTRALEQQLSDFQARFEDSGKQGADKELAQLRRELQTLKQQHTDIANERTQLATARDQAVTKFRSHVARTELTRAMLEQKAIPTQIGDAVDLMLLRAKVEVDDEGAISVEYGGRIYDSVAKAAEAFLTDKPAYKAHPGGGTGTRMSGGGMPNGMKLDELSETELIDLGVQQHFTRAGRRGR